MTNGWSNEIITSRYAFSVDDENDKTIRYEPYMHRVHRTNIDLIKCDRKPRKSKRKSRLVHHRYLILKKICCLVLVKIVYISAGAGTSVDNATTIIVSYRAPNYIRVDCSKTDLCKERRGSSIREGVRWRTRSFATMLRGVKQLSTTDCRRMRKSTKIKKATLAH